MENGSSRYELIADSMATHLGKVPWSAATGAVDRTTPPATCPDEPRRGTLVTVGVAINSVGHPATVTQHKPERQCNAVADTVTRSPGEEQHTPAPIQATRSPGTAPASRPGGHRPGPHPHIPRDAKSLFSHGRCTAVSVSTGASMYRFNRGDVSADRNQG